MYINLFRETFEEIFFHTKRDTKRNTKYAFYFTLKSRLLYYNLFILCNLNMRIRKLCQKY